jgi:hypothetical protein
VTSAGPSGAAGSGRRCWRLFLLLFLLFVVLFVVSSFK